MQILNNYYWGKVFTLVGNTDAWNSPSPWWFLAHSYCCNHTITPPSFNKHMSRFCKVGNGGRISLWEGPAGPHSLNACSPDVCLSLILLKESACFLTGLCWADEENGPPPPLASSDRPHLHSGFIYTIAQPLPFLWLWGSQGGQKEQLLQWDTMLPCFFFPRFPLGNLSLQFPLGGLCAQLVLKNIFVIKVYSLDTFFQQSFGDIFQLCSIFLIDSLSIVLPHKIGWFQQPLDEMPFSLLKVGIRSRDIGLFETTGHVNTDCSGCSNTEDTPAFFLCKSCEELLHRSCLVLLIILESEFLCWAHFSALWKVSVGGSGVQPGWKPLDHDIRSWGTQSQNYTKLVLNVDFAFTLCLFWLSIATWKINLILSGLQQ